MIDLSMFVNSILTTTEFINWFNQEITTESVSTTYETMCAREV